MSYESLVFDLYSHGVADFVEGFTHIDRKIGFLREKPCFLRVGVCMVNGDTDSGWVAIPNMKAAIRMRFAAGDEIDRFVTCHFGDTPAESRHMARTLLLPENLDAVWSRTASQPRTTFLHWLNNYKALLQELGIDPDDCCIVGSAGLEMQGIRMATDIDFTVKDALRTSRFNAGVTRFERGIDLVTKGYHRTVSGPTHSDDDLIEEPGMHLYFRGLKVVSPELIRQRKAFSGRPKDKLDVELIAAVSTPPFATS